MQDKADDRQGYVWRCGGAFESGARLQVDKPMNGTIAHEE
jgi:hypothetical protein